MMSEVILWRDGTYEINRNCVSDIKAEQFLWYSIRNRGSNEVRHGLMKICKTSKIKSAKKELAQMIVDDCNEEIQIATRKRNKFQKILESL